MKLLAFLLLAFAAGLYARHLLDRGYLERRRHAGKRAFLDGLLDAVDELSADAALSDALPDVSRRREVH